MSKREYLFRGKEIKHGRWVFGSLIKTKATEAREPFAYILETPTFIPGRTMPSEYFIEVKLKTVGQLIEVKSKNKRRVFEGDIMMEEGEYASICPFVVDYKLVDNCGCCHSVYGHKFSASDIASCVIIGNIFDNPGLLEKLIKEHDDF